MAETLAAGFESLTRTSTGDLVIDLTATRIGTETIKGVWLWGSRHTASEDPNPTDGISFGFGMSDGTTMMGGAFGARDGANNSFCCSRGRSDVSLTALNPVDRTVSYDIGLPIFGAGTITLPFTTTASAYKFGGLAFAGADIDCFVGHTGTITGSPTAPVDHDIPLPWEANFIAAFQTLPSDSDFDVEAVRAGSGYFMFGAATSPGNQYVFDHMNRNAQIFGELDYSMIRDDRFVLGRSNVGVLSAQYITFLEFGADYFRIRNGRSFSQGFPFMAFRISNGGQVSLFSRTLPLTPQQKSTIIPGFVPGAVFNLQAIATTFNSNQVDNAAACSFGVSVEDGDGNQFGVAVSASQTSDPTDNQHDAQSHAIYSGYNNDAQAIIGDFVSMDAEGVTEDYTAVNGLASITLSIAFSEASQPSGTPAESSNVSGDAGTFEDTVWDITFSPQATAWIPCPAPVSGGPGLAGVEDVEETGMGYWKIILDQVPLRTRAQVLYYREIEAKLTGRIGVALLTLCDGKFAPWPADMSTIEAYAGEAMAVAATSGSIQMVNGAAPRPGMQWSTGQRTYRIETVGAVQSGDVYPITFWPKVREAIELGAALEFVNLKLRCRLEDPAAMHVALETLRFGFPSLTFVEDVLPS